MKVILFPRNLRAKYKCNKVDDQPPCAPILRETFENCTTLFGSNDITCYLSIFLFTNGRIFDAWETVKVSLENLGTFVALFVYS